VPISYTTIIKGIKKLTFGLSEILARSIILHLLFLYVIFISDISVSYKLFNFMKYNRPVLKIIIKDKLLIILLSLIVMVFFFSACSRQPEIFTPDPTPTQELFEITPEPTLSLTFTPKLITPPYLIWLDPSLPETIRDLISQQTELNITPEKEQALMSISSAKARKIGSWTYLLVAPFYSSLDDVQISDLLNIWETGSMDIPGYEQLLMSEETQIHLSQFLGSPFSNGISITESDQITDQIWNDTNALAIIPFELLNPSLRVISINNKNPLTFSSNDESYPLSYPIYLTISDFSLLHQIDFSNLTNFDRSKLTSVVLTGVTALVRSTASIMETRGVLYPADDIRDILLSADITHISNEAPFDIDCPIPNSTQEDYLFCSSDSYIELLESIGTDIVELSGDHFGDRGPEAMFHTLELYDQHNLITYGGGQNLQAGLDPVIIVHNGNKIAFIGCNGKIFEGYATASETRPGASRCNFDWMLPKITSLSEEGYLVITTMQHEEVDSFFPISLQQYDFRRLSDAGASIVSGSQAHHPQGIEISGSKFIHYGLGNLFFDQWYQAINNPEEHINKDKAFIDFHYIYNGKYINTRLIPLQFIDNARPRLMTEDEEALFLKDFYKASKWNDNWIYLYPTRYYHEILEN